MRCRYCVLIKGNRVRVTRYEGEPDYSAEVRRTFAKFAEHTVKDYRVGFRTGQRWITWRPASLIWWPGCIPRRSRRWMISCARHSGYLDETIRVFDREVQFYAAYQDFIAPMKAAGLEFCYPALSAVPTPPS